MKKMKKESMQNIVASKAPFGDLHDYRTGKYLRPATQREQAASRAAAEHDGGAGVIVVRDATCFVVD